MSATQVGYYIPAYLLGSFTILISRSLFVVLQPVLSSLVDTKKYVDANEILSAGVHAFPYFSIPFFFASVFLGKEILEFYTNYNVANNAFAIPAIIALCSIFNGLTLFQSKILFIELKTKSMFYVNLFTSILNIILNIIFIYIFSDIHVAAITSLICYLLTFFIFQNLIKNFNLKYKIKSKLILDLIIISIVLSFSILLFKSLIDVDKVEKIILIILFNILVFFEAFFFFKSIKQELYTIYLIFKKRVR